MPFQKGHKINVGNNWNKGKQPSEKTKQKISETLKGNIPWNKGKYDIYSEETKQKMSEIARGRIPWNKGIICSQISEALKGHLMSEETRRKLIESHKGHIGWSKGKICPSLSGENNGNWKGGITPLSHQIRYNFKYRQWRSDVFTRDDFTCQECGSKENKLNTHHIVSFNSIIQKYEITNLEEALNCEELWSINNGITLCEDCHNKIPKKERVK